MPQRRNKLEPQGFVAQAANFLMNLAVAVSWLFRRVAQILAGRKTN